MESHDQNMPSGTRIDLYEIREVLGVGGFGITYKAWDKSLQRAVAVKEFLPAELAVRDGATAAVRARTDRLDDYRFALNKFLEEARTLARFNHPNIVRVTRFLEANGTGYLVMDYEEGVPLSSWLKTHPGPVPEEQLKVWFIPILRGLVEVHKAGFLHRDIKPGNIYLRDNGEPLLIDFGAARQAIGEHSRSVTGIVSAGYAPTEQYGTDAKKQGPWTDLYSVGATLYRCISGKDPVDAPTRQSAQFEGDPDPLKPAREITPGHYSGPFLQLIDELLVLPIKQRPQTAEPVLEALQAGRSLSPQEPRSTVVTQVIAPHTRDHRTPTPATSAAEHALPDHSKAANIVLPGSNIGTALKVIAGLALVAVVGVSSYLLGTGTGDPEDAVANRPPVTAVEPAPQASVDAIATAPPVVAVQPEQQPAPVPALVPEPDPVQAPEPEPVMGQLTLTLSPADARVVLPDIDPSYSPGMTLEPGSYRVRVSAPGYERWEERVAVGEEHTRLDVSLEPLPQRQAGDVFRDTLSGGGEGPAMVVLPTGRFRMGCVSGKNCSDDEKPVHEVTISRPIAMMKYEVTFAEYDRYAHASGESQPKDEGWGRQNRPVINVSWEDAKGYAQWISAQTGKAYRLPTEAEWEYAARAGTATQYSWGDSISCGRARYGRREAGECSKSFDGSVPVGSFSANPWGLHDLHGNVWEWMQDCFHDSYAGAPQTGHAWESECRAARGTPYRVLRGGSWASKPGSLRPDYRLWYEQSARLGNIGLRLVQDLAT